MLLSFEERLDDNFRIALDQLKFDYIHKVMVFLNWTWRGDKESPSEEQMRKSITGLYKNAKKYMEKDKLCACSSGGFEVTIYKTGKVIISFILTYTESPFGGKE